jgi:Ca2+-binding EF-hand superfamily protein
MTTQASHFYEIVEAEMGWDNLLLRKQLFRAFDFDGHGDINFTEFAEGYSTMLRGTVPEMLEFAWRMYHIQVSLSPVFSKLEQTEGLLFSWWRAAERRHPTGRERTGSPTLQMLQDPILLTPWVRFRGSRWLPKPKPDFSSIDACPITITCMSSSSRRRISTQGPPELLALTDVYTILRLALGGLETVRKVQGAAAGGSIEDTRFPERAARQILEGIVADRQSALTREEFHQMIMRHRKLVDCLIPGFELIPQVCSCCPARGIGCSARLGAGAAGRERKRGGGQARKGDRER